MVSESLYRQLVPEAPLHRRTDRDPVSDASLERYESLRVGGAAHAGPDRPSAALHAGRDGSSRSCSPSRPGQPRTRSPSRPTARSSGRCVPGTEFVVVHHASARDAVEEWFRAAGHADTVTYVPLPDYVSFTDWAEDAYVALADAIDDTRYLMEPWEFLRAGDALIADAVEEYTGIQASQAPLIFQGGNCLIGDDFWFLGTDYFADSIALLRSAAGPPVALPDGADLGAAVRQLFHDYVEAGRRLTLVGTRKPIAVPDFRGRREGDEYFLDLPSGGTGAFQPIFHIDMFVTLVGREDGRFVVLVGDPSQADELLGTTSPYGLADVYDRIAATLAAAGFDVRRNPLVHREHPRADPVDGRPPGDRRAREGPRPDPGRAGAGGGRGAGQHSRDRPGLAPRHLEQLPGREQHGRGPARLPADVRPWRRERPGGGRPAHDRALAGPRLRGPPARRLQLRSPAGRASSTASRSTCAAGSDLVSRPPPEQSDAP